MSEVPTLQKLVREAFYASQPFCGAPRAAALLTLVQFCREAGDQLEAELTQSPTEHRDSPTSGGE